MTGEPLSPRYDHSQVEGELYRRAEARGLFRAEPDSGREPYVIVIPPPNVTAPLHMGHGLNNTVQDLLIRWRRMQGREALWLPGTDHAGIATQNVVERQLAKDGTTRFDLGREAFVERVWDWVRLTETNILDQLRAIGSSCDWERTRFTLDEGLSRAVREVFVRLYEKGLIYRGHRIIHWCPRCLTALSDEEAEPERTQGKLYHLRYPLADGSGQVVVATTRPETMVGDTAVVVHPEDERYQHLLGREVELPLTGRRIPVLADAHVEREFGTGALKVTPAHDANDFEIAQRLGLAAIDVFTPEAALNEHVPEPFRGLDRFEARQRVVAALAEAGLVERVENHEHSVPHCYRCDTVVEPRLSDQWFVRMQPLAAPALQAFRDGRLRFTPDRFGKVYEHWLETIRDWCISRQLWWGHRIPVWYCRADGCGETVVAREDPTACPRCGENALQQDPDVLDTWFSSWLWPFSTMGWPDETPDLRTFYPNSTLVSGYDILFFWIARMIMAGLEFAGDVPFRDVYLTGMVRDHRGRKMSKSLGNGIDPLEVVRLFGADALRYTVVAGSGAGTDQQLNYEDLEAAFAPGRNFANKMWNAGRFALMNLGDGPRVPLAGAELELADRWILSRLARTVADVSEGLERFRLNEAVAAAYTFFWGDLADWYLELAKPRLYGDAGEASRDAARATLAEVLDTALRLLHPFMPFITEAVWDRLPRGDDAPEALAVAPWPTARSEWINADAERRLEILQEVIGAVRNIRTEYHVQPSQRVQLQAVDASDQVREVLAGHGRALRDLARVSEVRFAGADGQVGAAAVLRSGTQLFVPLSGVLDLARERSRIAEELGRVDNLLRGTEAKLANQGFVARAPAEVVERERSKFASYQEQRTKLAAQLVSLQGVP